MYITWLNDNCVGGIKAALESASLQSKSIGPIEFHRDIFQTKWNHDIFTWFWQPKMDIASHKQVCQLNYHILLIYICHG